MNNKLIAFNLEQRKKDMPELRAGDVVKVHRKIQEAGKERIQIFEGMVIATRGGQSSSPTITVRKVSYGVGVEIVVPMYSPSIEKIELVKRAKVRRSKLYYVREKTAKSLRFKFTDAKDLEEMKKPEQKEEVKEEVVEEKTPEAPKAEEKVEEKAVTEETKKEAEVKEEPKKEEVEAKAEPKKETEEKEESKEEEKSEEKKA